MKKHAPKPSAKSAPAAVTPRRPSTLDPQPATVLLAITGMSPAVLTETIWALAQETPPVIPSRVIVVTTAQGRGCLGQLFQTAPRFGGLSPWDALRQALEAQGHSLKGRLRFGQTADDIRVITAHDRATDRSVELPDLRNLADNEATADFLLEQVRSLVENPDTDLVVSLAGGRKTMGALLYACLTLAGRETDRLTHVLVSEPFETLREFWFPGQPGGPLQPPARFAGPVPAAHAAAAALHPATAHVELATVPFVPLRNLFVRELGRKPGTFSGLVAACRVSVRQRAAEHLRVALDPARRELEVNGQSVKLAPLEQLLLLFLATRTKHGAPAFGAYAEAVDALNAFREQQLADRPKDDFGDWRHADSLRANWDEQDIRKAVSNLRARLRQRGGDLAAFAACLPEKGRCSLDLPGPLIHLKA
jgi:CRISPR-associated protein (TIGR02584 family)